MRPHGADLITVAFLCRVEPLVTTVNIISANHGYRYIHKSLVHTFTTHSKHGTLRASLDLNSKLLNVHNDCKFCVQLDLQG